ncbi:hypothetical protein CRG98_042140 [Punica granatum]|uniref:Uncharacterized protein n=1 Tax=Punica granatum TaxID=22663 RepID=A0A2I0I0K0_PUNGR|nr:hypothetical protein CRG98_042140 [Punica granatum]
MGFMEVLEIEENAPAPAMGAQSTYVEDMLVEENEDEGSELNDTYNDMTNDVDLVDVNVALQEEGDWEVEDGGDEYDGFQSVDPDDEGGSASRFWKKGTSQFAEKYNGRFCPKILKKLEKYKESHGVGELSLGQASPNNLPHLLMANLSLSLLGHPSHNQIHLLYLLQDLRAKGQIREEYSILGLLKREPRATNNTEEGKDIRLFELATTC